MASITAPSPSVPSRRTLPLPARRPEGQDLGAGALLEADGAGGVVLVGVGEQDPADAVAAAAGDGVEVGGVAGTGVDDRDLVDADQVGVGAGAGHHPRVLGHDAPDHGRQGAGHAVDDGLGGADGGVVVVTGHPQLAAGGGGGGSSQLSTSHTAAVDGRAPAGPGRAGDHPAPAHEGPHHRAAHERPGGREQEHEGQAVADEARGDHERAGQQDEAAVGHLLVGQLTPVEAELDAAQHGAALALGQPGAHDRHRDEQADGVEDADAGRHLDDDGQLHEGCDDEERIRKAWGDRRPPAGSGRGAAAGCPPAYRRTGAAETAATRRGGRPSSPSDVTPFTSPYRQVTCREYGEWGPRTAWLERRDV